MPWLFPFGIIKYGIWFYFIETHLRDWVLKKSGTFKGFEFLKTGTFISWTVFYITILT